MKKLNNIKVDTMDGLRKQIKIKNIIIRCFYILSIIFSILVIVSNHNKPTKDIKPQSHKLNKIEYLEIKNANIDDFLDDDNDEFRKYMVIEKNDKHATIVYDKRKHNLRSMYILYDEINIKYNKITGDLISIEKAELK